MTDPEPVPNSAPLGEPEPTGDAGRALIEVVVLGVLVLIPVLYVLIALFRVQAATFAVTQAARDAGRLIETADSLSNGLDRARQAAAVSLADQNVPEDSLRITFVGPGAACSDSPVTPTLTPGASYTVCVSATLTLPGVPGFLTGDNNTTTAAYTVHIGELRESG